MKRKKYDSSSVYKSIKKNSYDIKPGDLVVAIFRFSRFEKNDRESYLKKCVVVDVDNHYIIYLRSINWTTGRLSRCVYRKNIVDVLKI